MRNMKFLPVAMVVLVIACSQAASAPAPAWSESEAVAVFKDWCGSAASPVSACPRTLLSWHNIVWSASFQPEDRRWVVTMEGETLFGKRQDPIISYLYENTQTVEWYVNR